MIISDGNGEDDNSFVTDENKLDETPIVEEADPHPIKNGAAEEISHNPENAGQQIVAVVPEGENSNSNNQQRQVTTRQQQKSTPSRARN